MRKLFAMLTVVALATGMTACSDDDGTETPKDPTTTNFNLRARGGNVMVTLTTSDYTIDIPAADADWIGLSEQSQGEVVVLSVKPTRRAPNVRRPSHSRRKRPVRRWPT